MDNYVRCHLSKKERSFMAQLRLDILPLKVETRRFERISLQDRSCQFCSENAIDDEEHFLFRCDLTMI